MKAGDKKDEKKENGRAGMNFNWSPSCSAKRRTASSTRPDSGNSTACRRYLHADLALRSSSRALPNLRGEVILQAQHANAALEAKLRGRSHAQSSWTLAAAKTWSGRRLVKAESSIAHAISSPPPPSISAVAPTRSSLSGIVQSGETGKRMIVLFDVDACSPRVEKSEIVGAQSPHIVRPDPGSECDPP